ncbi:MAG: rhodanese-like domain-containing protein [Clostridium sp.]
MFEFLKRDSGKVINVNDIDSLIGKIDLIDIRETYEYRSGSIKSAKNIPMGSILSEPEKYLKKEKEYYIVCQSGGRSGRAVKDLTSLGYDVVNVAGGVGSYSGSMRK